MIPFISYPILTPWQITLSRIVSVTSYSFHLGVWISNPSIFSQIYKFIYGAVNETIRFIYVKFFI